MVQQRAKVTVAEYGERRRRVTAAAPARQVLLSPPPVPDPSEGRDRGL